MIFEVSISWLRKIFDVVIPEHNQYHRIYSARDNVFQSSVPNPEVTNLLTEAVTSSVLTMYLLFCFAKME
jgi:hypothetical protein